MAKIDGDEVELSATDAALAKGMLARGDHQHHVAAWFGVDSRAISNLARNKTFREVARARSEMLPPPGPYRMDHHFVELYRRMVEINSLWERRRFKDAKALLEASLRSPVIKTERTEIDADADDLLRDEYGILK